MKTAEAKPSWMPETIGNYKIVSHIGQGGMGDIYKSVQKSLNRVVALKVLTPNMSRSEEFSRRFEIEAKAISLLQHQNIVSIYEYGEDQGYKFFAMQFVDGSDLAGRLAQKKILTIEEIVDYSKQICRGLRYAHSKDIVHRDIKPQNVIIDKNNVCKLTDFGIAKIFMESNITMTGVAIGTPEYMSPEQAEGEQLDFQTDIYSLGVVIYEMLTKTPPFTGNNPIAIAYKQVHEQPVPPTAIRKDMPKRLEMIVLKALKKNKMERYKTIEGILNDLDTVEPEQVDPEKVVVSYAHPLHTTHRPAPAPAGKKMTDKKAGAAFSNSVDYGTRFPLFTSHFWKNLFLTQGIALVLGILLTILFVLHAIYDFPNSIPTLKQVQSYLQW